MGIFSRDENYYFEYESAIRKAEKLEEEKENFKLKVDAYKKEVRKLMKISGFADDMEHLELLNADLKRNYDELQQTDNIRLKKIGEYVKALKKISKRLETFENTNDAEAIKKIIDRVFKK